MVVFDKANLAADMDEGFLALKETSRRGLHQSLRQVTVLGS
jgi:hypothetical protein